MGLGTAGLRGKTSNATFIALNYGVRLIDTAQAKEWYSEEGVGDGLRSFKIENPLNNEHIIIVTKIHPRSFELKKMEEAINNSKRAIYGDIEGSIDIMLLHFPHCPEGHCSKEEEVGWITAWKNLEHLKSKTNIKAIGVSNFDVNLLKQLVSIANSKVSVIQNWMDPFHQDAAVRDYAAEHSIVYIAYSSFGTQHRGENPVFTNKLLLKLAEKHNTTVSAVIISWLLQENVIAIPRASSANHIRENAAPIENGVSQESLRVFLSEEDLQAIRSLDGSLDK